MNYNLRHPVESVRTAPFGMSYFGVAAGYAGYQIMDVVEKSPTPPVGVAQLGIAAVFGAFMSTLGTSLVKRQFKRKEYLENSLRDGEFNEEDFGKTVPEWCMRQTARVVTQKHGQLERYKELCDDNIESQRLRYLPHF